MLKVLVKFIGSALALAIVAAGCAGPSPAERAQVQIRTVRTGCCYFEGALAFGRIEGPTQGEFPLEDTVARAAPQDPEAPRVIGIHSFDLSPGQYRLSAWERVCNGNCNELEPPTSEAAAEFEIAAGDALLIEITFPLGEPTMIVVNR